MASAPRDGTILDVRHVSKRDGELIFRTRWLAPLRIWIDWDRQHVELDKLPLKGWRISETQFRLWTPEEEATLAHIHGPEEVTYLDPVAWQHGIRRPVPGPLNRK